MISGFTVRVIIILLLIGGAVAYIGNFVGKYIGKRRLTIFNLRPRHTATAITVITGILIVVGTIAVLLMLSQDARTALLGLDRLKRDISEKNQELNAANDKLTKMNVLLGEKMKQQVELEEKLQGARQETEQLKQVKQQLSKEISTARQSEVIFKKGDVITVALIQAGPEKEKVNQGLNKIIAEAEAHLRALGLRTGYALVEVEKEGFNQTAYALEKAKGTYVVRLVADRNIVWGEKIPAHFEIKENALVFREGEEITKAEIPTGLSPAQVEAEVMKTLKAAHQAAKEKGIMPDPSGSVGTIPYEKIYDAAKKIKSANRKIILRVTAKKNTYVVGPLDVELKIGSR